MIKTFQTLVASATLGALFTGGADAALVCHLPLEGEIPGAFGYSTRFDGYSTAIDEELDIFSAGATSMSVSLWVAVPCYPIIEIDVNTKEKATIASCLNEESHTGFGFYLGMDGKIEFRTYAGGWPVTLESDSQLPVNEWVNLAAVLDESAHTLALYINGQQVASSRCNGSLSAIKDTLRLGHGINDRMSGPFNLMAFNGLMDNIQIWDEAVNVNDLASAKPENEPALYDHSERFTNDLLRPRFHGMPSAGWTNESHGMTYSDGRYHVFFQKNANGPYMARLHWGHISSENLYDWREEKIAIAPGESYDYKGCWSGCVFSDEELTGGKPSILYTGVDYARAVIAQATPKDDNLIEWDKNGVVINGRPTGLTDDFRDPYFFRNGDKVYIIVGSSKDGLGTTSLHRYENGRWTNDGSLFFTAPNASLAGTFWEMPNVTPMENGKWLFTATPLGAMNGVSTLYWTGSVNADGTFAPDAQSSYPRGVELISKDGYGMLSPTIYQHDGKTIALGIVPDKVDGWKNSELGWAHCYSLPREWSIGADGSLWQKPYEGLKGMRSETAYTKDNFTLTGVESLAPVSGRQIEIEGVFQADSSTFGYHFFKGSDGSATLSLNPTASTLTVDFTGLHHYANDNGSYNGVYSCKLPERIATGDEVTINLFIDGSILDIFINNRWATSIRVFPTSEDADGVEAFSDGATTVKSLKAWKLNATGSGVDGIFNDTASNGLTDVFSIDGICVKRGVPHAEALNDLPAGLYLIGGKKYLVK